MATSSAKKFSLLSCWKRKKAKIHVTSELQQADDDPLVAKVTNKELQPSLEKEEDIMKTRVLTNGSSLNEATAAVPVVGAKHDYFIPGSKKVHYCYCVTKKCSLMCVGAPPKDLEEEVINISSGVAEEDKEAVLYVMKASELKSATIEPTGQAGGICRTTHKLVPRLNIRPTSSTNSNRSSFSLICRTTISVSDLTTGFSDNMSSMSSYDSSPFLNKELPRKQKCFVLDDGDSTSSQEEATKDKKHSLPPLYFYQKSFEIRLNRVEM